MKKIFLFTSIILCTLSSNVFAQTIDTAFISQPIDCFGDVGELQANITTPTLYGALVGYYNPGTTLFISFGSVPESNASQQFFYRNFG
jgi:hypothetical protein